MQSVGGRDVHSTSSRAGPTVNPRSQNRIDAHVCLRSKRRWAHSPAGRSLSIVPVIRSAVSYSIHDSDGPALYNGRSELWSLPTYPNRNLPDNARSRPINHAPSSVITFRPFVLLLAGAAFFFAPTGVGCNALIPGDGVSRRLRPHTFAYQCLLAPLGVWGGWACVM